MAILYFQGQCPGIRQNTHGPQLHCYHHNTCAQKCKQKKQNFPRRMIASLKKLCYD